MGLGLRIYIINDDDTVRRFPFSRYERLLKGDSKERLLQYAGKKIRFAELKEDTICGISCGILSTKANKDRTFSAFHSVF
jgi:hypothetical protein